MATYQSEWLAKARALAPLVEQYRDEGEAQRHLPSPIFNAMREARPPEDDAP